MADSVGLPRSHERAAVTFEDLARQLCRARLDGTTVDMHSVRLTNADAYALQARVLTLIGDPSDSWKVGSTSAEAQAMLGTTEPAGARIPRRFCFQSPASVAVFPAHDVKLEAEFAFRLGADLPPRERAYTAEEVAAAVAGVMPALEIVGSRARAGLAGAGHAAVTADGGANIALVTGALCTAWRDLDLPSLTLTVSVNGRCLAHGEGRRALGHPLNVMVWLANQQRTRGGLMAGETVSTGTCSGLLELSVGDRVAADFAALGVVAATIDDAGA